MALAIVARRLAHLPLERGIEGGLGGETAVVGDVEDGAGIRSIGPLDSGQDIDIEGQAVW